LLAKVRKRLRQLHGFPRGTKNKFGIDAVFSTEPLRFPEGAACETGDENADDAGITGLNCAGFGSAMVVTAAFGLVAAAQVLRKLAEAKDAKD
jgi:tRNA A37 threonylcarbamoyladenosine dehydratase